MDDSPATRNQSSAYLVEGRLEDVLALIQVLGLAPEVSRTEAGLESALIAKPQSADSWMSIATIHCEFFRVYPGEKGPVASLAARRLLPAEDRKAFPPEFVKGLIEAAIRLHDTQLQRRQVLRVAWAGGALLALSAFGSVLSSVITMLKP